MSDIHSDTYTRVRKRQEEEDKGGGGGYLVRITTMDYLHTSMHIYMCVHTSHKHNIVMMLTYASISFAHHKHALLGATRGQLCKVRQDSNYLDFI